MDGRCPISFAYPQREHKALRSDIERVVAEVLQSGDYILGTHVRRFEQDFAAFTASPNTVAVSSGTDALVCALTALGIGPGDQFIVPAFGFVAAAEAVVRVGATPVFVDIEPTSLGPDPAACRAARNPRTRGVVVMHLFGQAVDLDPLRNSIDGLPIVEDAAQAIGTTWRGRHVGTLADIGTFSFFPAKSLGAAGDAGAVTTPNAGLAETVRACRSHGARTAYRWDEPGGNYRMDEIQAAILSVKLHALRPRLMRRREIGNRIASALHARGLTTFTGGDPCHPTYAPLVARTPKRNATIDCLRAKGIDARIHYPTTLCEARAFHQRAVFHPCPEAERATRELVSLPSSPELTDDEINLLIDAVAEVPRV